MTQVTLITLNELLEKLPNGDTAVKVHGAYEFARTIHDGRRRESGELYIDHDLAVAQIMVTLGVDVPTIIASLLHDSLQPHTGQTPATIEKKFGAEVALLVTGIENLYTYAEETSYKQAQAHEDSRQALEGVRRAILSIIEGDIRIILIRMADSLQDLRKAGNLPRERQLEIASEAMGIFAPLANRLGVWHLKWELEDLAFRYLEPEKYKAIASQLSVRRIERNAYLENCQQKLAAKIKEAGLKAEISGRAKHIYSISRKMERKKVDIDQIYDVQALRIILQPTDEVAYAKMNTSQKDDVDRALCYQALGLVHYLWKPIPREFDDYIAAPKPNGYKSLHTAVLDTETGNTLEVQIRTQRMHDQAELGVAAHWAYKEVGAKVDTNVQKRIHDLREVLTAMRDADSEPEKADLLETEVRAERIFVYTRDGDVIDLPAGATPIDFAYQIHTQIGHRCRGARINGKMASLDYRLKSGDRVEIITTNRGGPSRDWMNPSLGYTGSARTRSKIRQWFRNQEREKNIEQGQEVVERELKRLGLHDTYKVADIAQALKYEDVDDFLAKIGFGDIQTSQISGALSLIVNSLKPDDELRPLIQKRPQKSKGLTVQGISGMPTKMAGCCQPIPPEPIIGYITRGKGITVHTRSCNEVDLIREKEPERLIEVSWGEESETYPIPIVVRAYRRPNLIDDMISILRGKNIQVPRTKTSTAGSVMTVYLEAEISDLNELNWLLQKLENLPNVFEVQRQRWT